MLTPRRGKTPLAFGAIGGLDPRTPRFAEYLIGTPLHAARRAAHGLPALTATPLPAPPVTQDNIAVAFDKIGAAHPGATIADIFPMDGNDTIGDCVTAALFHASTLFQGMIGHESVGTAQECLDLYYQLTGGPDSGLNVGDTLTSWRANPVGPAGDKIAAYVSVDPTNKTHVQQAIQLFGAVVIGFTVQVDCIPDFDAGIAWTPGPATSDGHCVIGGAYQGERDRLSVLTWAARHQAEWEWLAQMAQAVYAVLPPEASQPGFEVPGFDVALLQTDLGLVQN